VTGGAFTPLNEWANAASVVETNSDYGAATPARFEPFASLLPASALKNYMGFLTI
jgi:hypothetical protein